MQLADPVYEQLRNDCVGFSNLVIEPRALLVDGNPNGNPVALRSAISLNGPATIQESFIAYKGAYYSISEINEMLTAWKRAFFQVK